MASTRHCNGLEIGLCLTRLCVLLRKSHVKVASMVACWLAHTDFGHPCAHIRMHTRMHTPMYNVNDASAKTWATPAVTGQLPTPRDKLACTVVGDHLVFYGGFGPTIEEVDDDDDDGAGAGGGAGVGGADASAPAADCATFGWFNDAYVFTAATGGVGGAALNCQKVQVGGFGPSARCAHAMCTIEGKAAVFGGRDSVGRTNDLFYLLPPGFDGLAGWNWSKPSAMGKGACCKLITFLKNNNPKKRGRGWRVFFLLLSSWYIIIFTLFRLVFSFSRLLKVIACLHLCMDFAFGGRVSAATATAYPYTT